MYQVRRTKLPANVRKKKKITFSIFTLSDTTYTDGKGYHITHGGEF